MKTDLPWRKWSKQGIALLKRYRCVLLIVAVGLVLLAWPFGKSPQTAELPETTAGVEEDFSIFALEEKMSRILSKVQGAGDVSVMLTAQSGARRVLAENEKLAYKGNGESQSERTTVIVSDGTTKGEEPVLVQQLYPRFQGALVVCEGGGDAGVRLRLMEAVSALTGLGADKILICKGKG